MRTEREMHEMDWAALVAPVDQILHGVEPENVLAQLGEGTLPDNTVRDTALTALGSLSASAHLVDQAALVLARRLHDRGVPYRTLAAMMDTSTMTIRRRITELEAADSGPLGA